MSRLNQRINKLIREFNETWELDIQISRILHWNKSGAQYTWFKHKGWLHINPDQSFENIKEDVFHELGHALIHQYRINHSFLRFFHDDSPKHSLTFINNMEEKDELPYYGFVSWYSTLNGTEDFCETLSAYVTNNYSFK